MRRILTKTVAALLILAAILWPQFTPPSGGGSGTGGVDCQDATGSTTTYTCPTPTPVPTSYTRGMLAIFVPQTTNTTTTPTLNVAGLGAKNIKATASTTVSAGGLVGGTPYMLAYDGTEFVQAGGGSTAGAQACTENPYTTVGAKTCTHNLGIASPFMMILSCQDNTGTVSTAVSGPTYVNSTSWSFSISSAPTNMYCYASAGGAGAAGAAGAAGPTGPTGSAGAFATLTDAAPVTWAIASVPWASATVTITATRTLNITNPVNGGTYVLKVIQGGAGSFGLTLGTGCTWKVGGGGGGAVTPSTAIGAIDILAFTYDGTNCYANFRTNFN